MPNKMKYYKITNKKEIHNNYQYKTGLNKNIISSSAYNCNKLDDSYFANSEHICKFLHFGIWIREVTIPKYTRIYKGEYENSYKANRLILEKRKSLLELDTWKWMEEQEIKFNSNAIYWGAYNGNIDIVKYLYKCGIKSNFYSIDIAVQHGNLAIVKFLIEQNTNISTWTVCYAAEYGHLDIVKYLWKISPNSKAIDLAASKGHFNIVKYLLKQGVKPTAELNNWALVYKNTNITNLLATTV